MTIPPRRYSLPNCTLVLEGIGSSEEANGIVNARPLMSMLTSVECQLEGQEEPLRGGSEFFQALVVAVSRYAQQVLSGIAIPPDQQPQSQLVTITPIALNRHRLVVNTQAHRQNNEQGSGVNSEHSRSIDLTTVQLFDLVEAIDQFLADDRTLPGLTVPLAPVSRRYLPDDGRTLERTMPAVIGISGLALAALACFYMPIPEVQRPKDPIPTPTDTEMVPSGITPQGKLPSSPNRENTGINTAPIPTVTPVPAAPTSNPSSSLAPSSKDPSPPTGVSQPQPINPDVSLKAPAITDSAKLDQLRQQLASKLAQEWAPSSDIGQDLTYQVTVGSDGAIIGYKPVDDISRIKEQDVPLLNLLYLPTTGGQANPEAIARFKVVFKPNGKLDVSPWQANP
ncbi:MAG: DUF4335 domain-containing protein [Cyanobacteria bacterium]|nr:DUF4335 domain-containing protein [Cyanobacteriota bacterium]MDW8201580.1 DUF4335 domain-containing protein [Cyanobacteriota bacterium SKYGB_h_bin112]